MRSAFSALLGLSAAVLMGGCSGFMYSQTGGVMSGYTQEHVTPYLLATADLDLACRTGAAFGHFLGSFEQVTDRPDRAALMAMLSAAMCAEAAAQEADLQYAKEVRAGRASDAQDAKRRGERWHLVAATRFAEALRRAENAFGPIGGKCPELEGRDELFYLLGLSSGLTALLHDRAAGGAAGVSMAIPRKVERATKCLKNERWWGLPKAMAAMVWLTVPGSGPTGVDPKTVLADSVKIGDAAGVRLARAMQVMAMAGSGDDKGLRAAIASHGKALKAKPSSREYRLLDTYATSLTRFQADLIWMNEKGHRGPTARLGELPAKAAPEDTKGDDELIEGL